jgi:enoyl-CoA hydratase/carnithine racemase
MSEGVVLSEPGVIWRVALNRPAARNALSSQMREALLRALSDAAGDPDCRVVVLGGVGDDFCAGADLAELASAVGGVGGVDYVRTFDVILEAVENQPQPVIAAVSGEALGAGCLLVLASDLAVAAVDARLSIPAARLGVVVSYEMVERLVAAAGPKRAADLLESGHEISGAVAAEWGLVNRAVPRRDLPEAVDARHLALDRSTDAHCVADFDRMAAESLASEDAREGLAALRERRRPDFKGR